MIDFNSLPLEIKRMVAKQLRRSDESYRIRVGKPNTASREQLKGRGLATLSLVNRELRKICLKGLFWRVKSSRVRDEIFEYHILENHATLITCFKFEGKMSLETTSFIVLYVLPRLPNLHRIIINDHRFFTPFVDLQPPSLDWNRSTFVWRKLVEISKRIDKWHFDFGNNADDLLETLLTANASRIQYLVLHPNALHPFLSAETKALPCILDQSPALRRLQLHISHPPGGSTQPDPVVSDVALLHDYAFQNNLTMLDICCVSKRPNSPSPVDVSIFHFASLFPGLVDFHICGKLVGFEPENTETFSFPRLLRFEFGRWSPSSTAALLKRMELPQIRYLDCHFDDSIELAKETHRNLPDLLLLAHQFADYSNTLHSLRLHAKHGLYSSSLTSFLDVLSPHSFEIDTTWDQGEAESQIEIVEESTGPSREMVLDGLTAGSKGLIEWAKDRIEETEETKDLSGARQMYKALKNVKDLRKWLKE